MCEINIQANKYNKYLLLQVGVTDLNLTMTCEELIKLINELKEKFSKEFLEQEFEDIMTMIAHQEHLKYLLELLIKELNKKCKKVEVTFK